MEYFHKSNYVSGVSRSMITWQHIKQNDHVPMNIYLKYFRVEVFKQSIYTPDSGSFLYYFQFTASSCSQGFLCPGKPQSFFFHGNSTNIQTEEYVIISLVTAVGFSHWQTRVSSRTCSTDADMLLTLCDPQGPIMFRVLPAVEYFRFVFGYTSYKKKS